MHDPVMTLFRLSGKTALITGGSRGLGLQVAEALGEAGAEVIITARKSEELAGAVRGLEARGIRASWIAGDARDPIDVHRVCQDAIQRLGHVDILVNNAGATWGAPAETHPIDAWDKVVDLNLRAVFLFSQYIARHSMIPRGSGRIIMMASIAGLGGNGNGIGSAAYNASKAGVINLVRALAVEWGRFDIQVNAIAPGFFPTKMTRKVLARLGADYTESRAPLRRIGDDSDLKGVALLFASAAGRHITGQVLAVDGGASCVVG